MMPALDTDVLVRWLVDDDDAQCAAVERLLRRTAAGGASLLFVPVTVLLETERVLRSRYRFGRASVSAALDALLSAPELQVQQEAAVERAVWLFKQAASPAFADCLHIGLAHEAGRAPLLSLDARAAALPGAAPVR